MPIDRSYRFDDDGDGFCRACAFARSASSAFVGFDYWTHYVLALDQLDRLEGTVFVADGAVLIVRPGDAFFCVHYGNANRKRMFLLYGYRTQRTCWADL